LLVAVGSGACQKKPTTPEVPALLTPAWRDVGDLFVRRESDASGVLLIRHIDGIQRISYDRGHDEFDGSNPSQKVVYRYDPSKGTLEPVTAAEWKSASGTIIDCNLSLGDPAPLVYNDRAKTLRLNGTPVRTAGQTVLSVAVSPDKQSVAVLSAEGPWRPSVVPHIGGGNVSGARIHEILHRKDGSRLGAPIRITTEGVELPGGGCWSADGRYVIYTDAGWTRLWIHPVPMQTTKDRP